MLKRIFVLSGGILRRIVMLIYGVTGITPDKIITYFIVFGSLVFFEVSAFLLKKIIIGRLRSRQRK